MNEAELKDLMIRALAGDAGAYARLLAASAARLRGFFRARMRARAQDVEDLVQETLFAIHVRRAAFDPARLYTPWLFAIAKYKLADYWRRLGRAPAEEPIESAAEIADTEGDGGAPLRDVMVLLNRLPPRQRDPIRLVKLDGLSVAEAARRLGMSESAVKVGTHRGIRALAAMMQSQG